MKSPRKGPFRSVIFKKWAMKKTRKLTVMRHRKESHLRSEPWGGEQREENRGGGELVLGGEADLWVWRKDAGA